MSIVVQVRTPAGEWVTKTDREVGLPGLSDWSSEDPRERSYVLYQRIAGVFSLRWPDLEPLCAFRGWPADMDPERVDVGDRGITHATLAELRAADWCAAADLCGSTPDDFAFVRWLSGPELTALAAEHGPEGVRLLIGFD